MKQRSSSLTTLFAALLVMALWGSLYPMIKVGYAAFGIETSHIPSILVFAGIRFTLCGLLIVTFSSAREKKFSLPKRSSLGFVLMGAFSAIILHYSLTYIALSLGEGSKSAIIKQVGYLFLCCFAFLFNKNDKFSMRKVMAGMLGFCGIIATAIDGNGISFAIGDVLLLLSSACSAFSTIIAQKATQRISPVAYTGYSQLIGGVCLLVPGILLGGRVPTVNSSAIMTLMYICAASIGAYVLWNSLLRSSNISKLSVIKFTEPLFACLFGALLLSENVLKWQYLVAFILISSGIIVGNKKENK